MPRDLGNCYDLNYYRDKLWEVDSFCATGSWEGNEKWFTFQVYKCACCWCFDKSLLMAVSAGFVDTRFLTATTK